MGKVVHMLSSNLTEAPVREGDEDRRSREEVKEYILAEPIDFMSSWFLAKGKYKP